MEPWISTYTGKRFCFLNMIESEICIEDIAHALSNLCRFTGHCKWFYSVAEHSVRVALLVPAQLQLQALLHDASEAYINDISSPLKSTDSLYNYTLFEGAVNRVLDQRFGHGYPFDQEVLDADKVLLSTEARDLLSDHSWIDPGITLKEKIEPLTPLQAEGCFLLFFQRLTKETVFDQFLVSLEEKI